MKMTMRLTAADLIRALSLRVHALADDIENDGKTGATAAERRSGKEVSMRGSRQ